jgi:hypothetical protein
MPSPFPGMDPSLEHPRFFADLHSGLIFAIKQVLQPILPQSYCAQSGERVWLETSQRSVEPDVNVTREMRKSEPARRTSGQGGVAIAEPELETDFQAAHPVVITVEDVVHDEHIEPFLEIRGRWGAQDRLVATIEVVSPSNKTPGDQGYDRYRAKQREILGAQVHLIEIDFLRDGTHVTAVPRELAREKAGPFDYHVSVHHFNLPREYSVYPIRLEQRLPGIEIPLLPEDPSVLLDLQAAFNSAYDAGPYRKRISYGEDPIEPPLRIEQAGWIKAILQAAAVN